VAYAVDKKIEPGKQSRIDCTVVETNTWIRERIT